jgi:hypothetical protein
METQKIPYNLAWQFHFVMQELLALFHERPWLLSSTLQQEIRCAIRTSQEKCPSEQQVRSALLRLVRVGLLAYSVRQNSGLVETFSWFLAYVEQVPTSAETADKTVEILVPVGYYQTSEPTKPL